MIGVPASLRGPLHSLGLTGERSIGLVQRRHLVAMPTVVDIGVHFAGESPVGRSNFDSARASANPQDVMRISLKVHVGEGVRVNYSAMLTITCLIRV